MTAAVHCKHFKFFKDCDREYETTVKPHKLQNSVCLFIGKGRQFNQL